MRGRPDHGGSQFLQRGHLRRRLSPCLLELLLRNLGLCAGGQDLADAFESGLEVLGDGGLLAGLVDLGERSEGLEGGDLRRETRREDEGDDPAGGFLFMSRRA